MPLRRTTPALAAGVSLLIAASCIGGPPAPVIRIGVDLPLAGVESGAAQPALNGIRYFVQQNPTLDGFSIELAVRDDSSGGIPDAVKGADNIKAFVSDPSVLAVIGPFDSSVARAEIPVANQAQLAMVSPVTSSPCLTRDDYLPAALSRSRVAVTCKAAALPPASELRPSGVNNYFRLAPTDELQGPAAAEYMFKTLQVLRVGVISDRETYGQALSDGFTTRFTRLGGSVVGRLDLDVSSDPGSFLRSIKAEGAQGVYFGGITANRGCEVRSEMASVFGTDPVLPFVGGDGIAEDPACLHDAGSAYSDIYATVPAIDPASMASANGVVAGFKSAFPNRGDYGRYTVIAYDAAGVVYSALDHAIRAASGHVPPRANLISQLAETTRYEGATGTFGFDPAGDTTHRVISIVRSPRRAATAPWTFAGSVDYTAALPY